MARYNQKVSTDRMIEAIRGSRGIKSAVALKLGVHRDTVSNYIDRYATVRQAYWEEREAIVDTAEVQLLIKLNQGEWPAIAYVLSRLGKDRGYAERPEVTGREGNPWDEISTRLVEKLQRIVDGEARLIEDVPMLMDGHTNGSEPS